MNAKLLVSLAKAIEADTRSHRDAIALAHSKEETQNAKNHARWFYYWTQRAGIVPLLKSVEWQAFDPVALECSLANLWSECHPHSESKSQMVCAVAEMFSATVKN